MIWHKPAAVDLIQLLTHPIEWARDFAKFCQTEDIQFPKIMQNDIQVWVRDKDNEIYITDSFVRVSLSSLNAVDFSLVLTPKEILEYYFAAKKVLSYRVRRLP